MWSEGKIDGSDIDAINPDPRWVSAVTRSVNENVGENNYEDDSLRSAFLCAADVVCRDDRGAECGQLDAADPVELPAGAVRTRDGVRFGPPSSGPIWGTEWERVQRHVDLGRLQL